MKFGKFPIGRPIFSFPSRSFAAFGLLLIVAFFSFASLAEAICKPGLVRKDGQFIPAKLASHLFIRNHLQSSGKFSPFLASAQNLKEVRLRYLGHSSFLLTGPQGARVVMDPYVIPITNPLPDAVTVSNFHETHSITGPYEKKAPIFFGVTGDGKPNTIEKVFRSLRVMSFPQLSEGTDTPFVENTIFIFQAAGLCVAHFGNARLGPSESQIRALGKIHVLLLPIDGSFTVPHEVAAKIVKRIGANVVIPMHYFGPELPSQFFAALKAEGIHEMKRPKSAEVVFSLRKLPPPTVYMVLPSVEDVP